jgi:hypothetical protein
MTYNEAIKSDCFVKVLFFPSLLRRGSGGRGKFGLLAKPLILYIQQYLYQKNLLFKKSFDH